LSITGWWTLWQSDFLPTVCLHSALKFYMSAFVLEKYRTRSAQSVTITVCSLSCFDLCCSSFFNRFAKWYCGHKCQLHLEVDNNVKTITRKTLQFKYWYCMNLSSIKLTVSRVLTKSTKAILNTSHKRQNYYSYMVPTLYLCKPQKIVLLWNWARHMYMLLWHLLLRSVFCL